LSNVKTLGALSLRFVEQIVQKTLQIFKDQGILKKLMYVYNGNVEDFRKSYLVFELLSFELPRFTHICMNL